MATVFVNNATADSSGAQTSVTAQITASGTNRMAFMIARSNSSTNDLSSITYDGVAASLLGTFSISASDRCWVYYLVNQTTTSNANVVATFGSARTCNIRVANYQGLKQSSPVDASSNTTVSSASSFNATTVSTTNGCLHIAGIRNDQGNFSVTNGTLRDNTALGIVDSTSQVIPAGSNTIGLSWTGSGNGGYFGAMFIPDIIPTSSTGSFLLNFI